MIRTSQAIMFVTHYLTPSNRAMFCEVRKDSSNSLVKETISRDAFKKVNQVHLLCGQRQTGYK